MFAVVLLIISVYLAIRLSLSEACRRITQFRDKLKKYLKEEENFATEMMSQKTAARRRSGVVSQVPKSRNRKFTKEELLQPFLDTGDWFNYEEKSTKLIEAQALGVSDEQRINMLKVPTCKRDASLLDRFCNQISFIVQKDTKVSYPDVSEKVLSSERVINAIKTSVMEDLKGRDNVNSNIIATQQLHKQRAIHVLHQMKSCISSFLLKIAAWVMYKLLGKMLDSIEVQSDQVDSVKKVSKEKIPMIYLPLHRSHLDYILVTFILFMNDIRAPLVAAGNNLMIPFFGALLRGLGAFFIKRKLDPQNGQRDHVYRAILHTYMEENLRAGHSLEFFTEGGRSRTGKAVLPKAGLLSIVVDTFMSGGISDAYIVPIAISYEKLLDGNFISEQLGRQKKMENFPSAISAIWRTLRSNFGSVRVDFCQPFSLKEFLLVAECSYSIPTKVLHPFPMQECVKSRRRSEYGTEIVTEDHRQLIKDLADYAVQNAFCAYSLMSTNVLAFLLLTKYRKGASFDELVIGMDWLRNEIKKRNKSLNFYGDSPQLIARATRLLGKNLIDIDAIHMDWSPNNLNNNNVKLFYYKPAVHLPEVLELQYYGNSVLNIFLHESIVVNAALSMCYNTVNRNNSKRSINRRELLKHSIELCCILQYEFIFSPPGTNICNILNSTIDDFLNNSLLQLRNNSTENDSSALPDLISDDSFLSGNGCGDAELYQEFALNIDDDNWSKAQFLKSVLTSFIEAYYISACSLPLLLDTEIEESSLLHEIKNIGCKKIQCGDITHEECLGLDTLKNTLKLFETWKILNVRSKNSQKLYSLHAYFNSSSNLKDVINRLIKHLN